MMKTTSPAATMIVASTATETERAMMTVMEL